LGFLESNLNPRTILQRHLLQGNKLLQRNTVLAAGKINVLEFLTVLGNVLVQALARAVGHLSYDEKLSRNLAQEIAKNSNIALPYKGLSKAFYCTFVLFKLPGQCFLPVSKWPLATLLFLHIILSAFRLFLTIYATNQFPGELAKEYV